MCCIKSSWWSCFQIVQCSRGKKEGICEGRCLRVVNPPCPQILRIDREGTIDKVIMHSAYDVICHLFKLYNLTWLAYYPPITLLLILQWHTRVCEETFNVNSKITQTMQNIRNFIVRKSIYKKWKISDSHLETGRKSSKSENLQGIYDKFKEGHLNFPQKIIIALKLIYSHFCCCFFCENFGSAAS